MEYPNGTKGYHLWDKIIGVFFVALDIIFDKNLPSIASTDDSDDEEDSTVSPSTSPTTLPSSIASVTTSLPPPVLCKSSYTQIMTEGITTSKVHLLELWKACELCPEGVLCEYEFTFAEPDISEDLEAIKPNVNISNILTNLIIEEHSNVTIRSNYCCNLSAPDYDLKIPLATYDEVMRHSDQNKWLTAMQANVETTL